MIITDVQRYFDDRVTEYVRWKASLGYQIYTSSLGVLHNEEDCRITLVKTTHKATHVTVIVLTHESCDWELINRYKFYDRIYHYKIYSKYFNSARDVYINKTVDIDDYYNLTVDVPFYEVEEDLVRNKVAVTESLEELEEILQKRRDRNIGTYSCHTNYSYDTNRLLIAMDYVHKFPKCSRVSPKDVQIDKIDNRYHISWTRANGSVRYHQILK